MPTVAAPAPELVDVSGPWAVVTVCEAVSKAVGRPVDQHTDMETLLALAREHEVAVADHLGPGAVLEELLVGISEYLQSGGAEIAGGAPVKDSTDSLAEAVPPSVVVVSSAGVSAAAGAASSSAAIMSSMVAAISSEMSPRWPSGRWRTTSAM